MSRYTVEAEAAVEAEVEAAFNWYKGEEPNLGFEFLEELSAAYQRILDHPFSYQDVRSGIRRALTRRFPYAVFFSVERQTIVILAVLHTARDPAEWQHRI